MPSLDQAILTLVKYPSLPILVTGPQRSGTTIAGRILAQVLKRTYVDEREYDGHDIGLAKPFLRPDTVVQGPGLCIDAEYSGAVVVMMRRPIGDIIRSEERIEWTQSPSGGLAEKDKYAKRYQYLVKWDIWTDMPICSTKYRIWEIFQRDACLSIDLRYESMVTHPLWVPKAERANWHFRQYDREGSNLY